MTENEFWTIVNVIQAKNRPKLLAAGMIRSDNPAELETAKRLYGDPYELGQLDDVPKSKLREMGELLFKKDVSFKAKEMIIMTLAHEEGKDVLKILQRYNKCPDDELRYFAEFALQECEWGNE